MRTRRITGLVAFVALHASFVPTGLRAEASPPAQDSRWIKAKVLTHPGADYADDTRTWQGIPGIERAPGGRLWAVWYSGGTGEGRPGNYMLAATSGDDGKTWSAPKLAIVGPTANSRINDPLPWLDPNGRLWIFYWQITPADSSTEGFAATFAIHTDEPDSADPVWSEPRFIHACGPLFGKPIIRPDGAWIAPFLIGKDHPTLPNSAVLISADAGETWSYLGGTNVPGDVFDFSEATLALQDDDSLWMALRRREGISGSFSHDGGRTWSDIEPIRDGPTSRACMKRLASGNHLLVYHDVTQPLDSGLFPRARLTAWLSEDGGRTWPHQLLLHHGMRVSYPDATQAPDGRIFIAYDNDRYHFDKEGGGKEILLAVIREEDIRAGELVSQGASVNLRINQATGIGNERE